MATKKETEAVTLLLAESWRIIRKTFFANKWYNLRNNFSSVEAFYRWVTEESLKPVFGDNDFTKDYVDICYKTFNDMGWYLFKLC